MGNTMSAIGEALNGVAELISDREVLHAITSHLTAREVIVIAKLFEAAGEHEVYGRVMEGIIHGDEEVRAVAAPLHAGSGTVRIEYFNDFVDCGVEEDPIYVRAFDEGGLHHAMQELRLKVDEDQIEWAATEIPGLVVLDSAIRS